MSAATSFSVFVTLDALYVEGLVHITELGSEYFRFDEARQELRGERSGVRYAVGARVRVQVSRVDLDGRRIDFRMVREGEGERLISRGRAGTKERATPLAEAEAVDRAHKQAAKAARARQPGRAAGAGKAAKGGASAKAARSSRAGREAGSRKKSARRG